MHCKRRRAVLLWGIAVGLLVPVYFFTVADISHLAWDFRAYYAAASAALAGEPFVGISPGLAGVSYVYPPIAVVLFLPQAVAGGWRSAFLLQTILNVATALGLAALIIHMIETHRKQLPTADRLLIAGFCLGSAPVTAILGLGQVDMLIALALAVAFLALERNYQGIAGAAIAGAALVKVFPAVLGLWLAWRRQWRAIAAAVATGVSGLAVGVLLFGLDAYSRYLVVLAERSRVSEFAGTVSPKLFVMSLFRPLSQLLPTIDPHLYAPLSLALLAPGAWFVARRSQTVVDRLMTYLVAIMVILLVSPASNTLYVVYVYFPLLCLLYLDAVDRGGLLLLAGLAAIAVPIQPTQIGTMLAVIGVSASVSSPVLAAIQSVLTVVSVPLVGLLAVFAWCIFRVSQRQRSTTTDSRPVRAD